MLRYRCSLSFGGVCQLDWQNENVEGYKFQKVEGVGLVGHTSTILLQYEHRCKDSMLRVVHGSQLLRHMILVRT